MKGWLRSLAIAALVVSASALGEPHANVTDNMLRATPAADWLSFRGNLAGWGYSELAQINAGNVRNLTLAWSAPIGAGPNEGTPIVHAGVLYMPHPNDVIQALDAANGDLLWEYRREFPKGFPQRNPEGGFAPGALSGRKRNIAIYGDAIFTATGDAHVLALDAASGAVRWQTSVGDYRYLTHTSGPIVARGKVFTGRTCDPALPGGCFIAAHDAQTGRELWRRAVIARSGEAGGDSWGKLSADRRRHAGAWGVGSFDHDANLLIWGTSVPAPSPEFLRNSARGELLHTNSTLALNADSGEIVWRFQHLPRDNWDFDHAFERMLVDIPLKLDRSAVWVSNPRIRRDEMRRVVTGIPGKTGIFWTLDRTTGEFLWARPTVMQNVVRSIDARTGRVTVNEDVIPDDANDEYGLVCPAAIGGKNWMAGAYSPQTKAVYAPLQNTCMEPEITSDAPGPADMYALAPNPRLAPNAATLGRIEAVSVETGATLWRVDQRAAPYGMLTTGGGLLIAGDSDRRLRAYDARSGTVLWETVLSGPVAGHPISYEVNGVQYIAVAAGGGDLLSGVYNALAGLPTTRGGNTLYVFALPQSATTRAVTQAPATIQTSIAGASAAVVFSKEQAERGAALYGAACARCHGPKMRGAMAIPSLTGRAFLRRWSTLSAADFAQRIQKTMPPEAPGSLPNESVLDLVAHWYAHHGYQPAEQALKTSELKQLRVARPDLDAE